MIRIAHVAIWTQSIEKLLAFYVSLGGTAGSRYSNPLTGFQSYFVSFGDQDVRIELMSSPDVGPAVNSATRVGYAHVALALGSREAVDQMTAKLSRQGMRLVSAPRKTGDGYYESVIEDPDGNRIELVA